MAGTESEDRRRGLPKVDAVVGDQRLAGHTERLGRRLVVGAVRDVLAASRAAVGDGGPAPDLDQVVRQVAERLDDLDARRVRAVVNATGVVLHTNLGRAPLAAAATDAVLAAAGYCTVEFDTTTGRRGRRGRAANALLRELTGAPAALVVNNAAAAILLALGALAGGREVIVSRGELIEIGGEFRLPDIMAAAGATLVEVGTTNRTHLRDYAGAITDRTALLLVVHPSNYRIDGFTTRPVLPALAELAGRHRLPLVHDLGSGLVNDELGTTLGTEPSLIGSLRQGCDLVICSGDKLFGGPQAGLVAGRADLVDTMARHPVARAVRIDKLTMAALEATLLAHLTGRHDELPVWLALSIGPDDVRPRARRLADRIGAAASLRDGVSVAGGGSLPGEGLPSVLVDVDPAPATESAVLARLRAADPPVVARAERGRVTIDLRTVPPEQDGLVAGAVCAALTSHPHE